MIPVILTAVNTKQLTYAKLKKWFLKNTCFGIELNEFIAPALGAAEADSVRVLQPHGFLRLITELRLSLNNIIVFCKGNQLIGGCLWIFFPYVLKAFFEIWLVIMEVVLQK